VANLERQQKENTSTIQVVLPSVHKPTTTN